MKEESFIFSKKNRLKNVKFFPFQNQKKLVKFYQKSDVFILPSRIEPWGLAINEAMSSGNAIITSNVTGASFDLIRNNKNGLIFENNNSDDLAKKILFIYNNKKKVSYYKKESVKIIRQALNTLPEFKEGESALSGVPKKIRPKKGEVYSRYESARGDVGFYIRSDGKNIPTRVKMRSHAYCNLSVLNEIAAGWMISDVITILCSLDIVLGEIDR